MLQIHGDAPRLVGRLHLALLAVIFLPWLHIPVSQAEFTGWTGKIIYKETQEWEFKGEISEGCSASASYVWPEHLIVTMDVVFLNPNGGKDNAPNLFIDYDSKVENKCKWELRSAWCCGKVPFYGVLRSLSVGELGESDFHSVAYSRFWCSESVDQRK